MPAPATTLEEARKYCAPKPLLPNDPDLNLSLWVETQEARDESGASFRDRLRETVDLPSSTRVLVYGHTGCGKSTEFSRFVAELPENFLVVRVNTRDFLPIAGIEAADVLLAGAMELARHAKERGLVLNEAGLRSVLEYFEQVSVSTIEYRSATGGLATEGTVASGALGRLLQIFGLDVQIKAGLKGELSLGSRTEESRIVQIRKQRSQLSNAIAELASNIEISWQQRVGPHGKLLVIFEELDKMSIRDGRAVFIDEGPLLAATKFRAIYTIPIFVRYAPDAHILDALFDGRIAFPMIKVNLPSGEPYHLGRQTLAALVRRRIAANVLTDAALQVLIAETGGVLRHLFESIKLSLTFRSVRAQGVIDEKAAKEALARMVNEIGIRIAPPLESKVTANQLREELAAIVKKQRQGEIATVRPDETYQILLKSETLIEYNGHAWVGVHPLAVRYLEILGLLRD